MPKLRDPRSRRPLSGLFLAGIFILFAPIGVLVGLVQSPSEPAGWAFALLLSAVSGTQAVAWAFIMQRGRWWLLMAPVLIAIPFLVLPRLFKATLTAGYFTAGYEWKPNLRQAMLLVLGCAELGLGFTLISIYIRRSERDAARAQAELDVASRMHESLVPPIDVTLDGWRVLARSRASSEMGGDVIDCVPLPASGPDRVVNVYLADVSGHGVGAGVVMAMLKSAVRTRLLAESPLAEVVRDLNRVLTDVTRPEMFATFAGVRLAPGGHAEYVLAGHLPIFLCRSRAAAGTGPEVVELPNQHLPLGIDADEAFASDVVSLSPGDAMVIITDGLTEVQDRSGRELGLAAIRTVLSAAHARADVTADTLLAAVLEAAQSHGRQLDDQSVLVLHRVPHGPAVAPAMPG